MPGIERVVIVSVVLGDVFKRIQHWRQFAAGQLSIERLAEKLEIDIGRIHRREEFRARLTTHKQPSPQLS